MSDRQGGIEIEDGSGDRKYFTIIPNYILNHSTMWDREVYIQMKRVAGEKGVCWLSEVNLAKQCGISRDRLRKSIKYLIEHRWIEELPGQKIAPSKFNPLGIGSKRYRVVDLWQTNNTYYAGQKNLSSDDNLDRQNLSSSAENLSSGIQKEEPKQKKRGQKILALAELEPVGKVGELTLTEGNPERSKQIVEVFDLWKLINPAHRLYGVVTQRKSVSHLIEVLGFEELCSLVKALPSLLKLPYCPSVGTPWELENKFGKLQSFYEQSKRSSSRVLEINI